MNHPKNLGLELHTLVSRLERAGDQILRSGICDYYAAVLRH